MIPRKSERPKGCRAHEPERQSRDQISAKELVILTGISGAGKASALKTFEDLGYQAVDNLPLELMPEFAGMVAKSEDIDRAAIVVDIREGQALDRLPALSSASRGCCPRALCFWMRRIGACSAVF